jgi:hypothetical protein
MSCSNKQTKKLNKVRRKKSENFSDESSPLLQVVLIKYLVAVKCLES